MRRSGVSGNSLRLWPWYGGVFENLGDAATVRLNRYATNPTKRAGPVANV
jgi:hypothetical protein